MRSSGSVGGKYTATTTYVAWARDSLGLLQILFRYPSTVRRHRRKIQTVLAVFTVPPNMPAGLSKTCRGRGTSHPLSKSVREGSDQVVMEETALQLERRTEVDLQHIGVYRKENR